MKRILLSAMFTVVVSWTAIAQVAQPQPSRPHPAAPSQMSPIGMELQRTLSQLESVGQQMATDVGRVNIKKWKTDSRYKEQSQHDADSIQANVTGTLPSLIAQIRSAPDNIAYMFKLYRNVDALYDVLKGLTESAGAFGSKGDFDTLQTDAQNLTSIRASLGTQVDAIATAQQAEVNQLRAQAAQARAAAAAAPPKKIVVDDEPAKKPTRKKKATKPSAAKNAQGQTTSQPHQ